MTRQINQQQIAWFWDLHQRKILDLDPPYQRRSVWNQEYKDYFIDTVLKGYPSPAVFIYQETSPDGAQRFSVVDGKQRLTSLFEFASNQFIVSEDNPNRDLSGKYFQDLDPATKAAFWGYPIAIETLPSTHEAIVNDIFDRINRNVAKLTRQELRHAKLDGEFISAAELMTEFMNSKLPPNFPNIARSSRKQMKDVEFTSHLLLLIEEGPRSYSQDALDQAFTERDIDWPARDHVVSAFQAQIGVVTELLDEERLGFSLRNTSLKNQADFYSFFGALVALGDTPSGPVTVAAERLHKFLSGVANESIRTNSLPMLRYYEAARSASNDIGPRTTRIDIVTKVLSGQLEEMAHHLVSEAV